MKDACCIIYSGIGSNPWWEHKQLLIQVDKVIEIFKDAHPDCIALFVFNQSSMHTLLKDDALYAFDINRLNGGT